MRALIILSVVAAAFASQQCGENSHFETCGTACPLTCDNYDNPPKFCVLRCDIGCQCDEGYVRSADGRCVRPSQCPVSSNEVCGENSHFESCGTACPLTCENYDDPPKACILRCDIGCQCDEGYVRSLDGRCVKPAQCPVRSLSQECGENSHFESCGTACPLTCDNYDNPPQICVLRCDIGCQCDEGYVRNADGRCVRPAQCPVRSNEVCGENSHFESCGTACPLTCDNYDNPPKFCVLRCDIGCQCDEGYVRNADGRCVRPAQCPVRGSPNDVCGENQRYSDCASPCPLTCENYDNPPLMCPAMCIFGCECKDGYVKTKDGKCVRPEECPNRAPDTAANCMDPPDKGMCLAYVPQWYYDAKTGKCEKFVYGGCRGNGNRYPSEEKCMENCQGIIVMNSTSDVCSLPSETGLCRGFFPRYFFDKSTGRCERFVYGGCGGNENNFESVEECQKACASAAPTACEQEKEVGPCRAAFRRYYYNKETGKCEEFIYGGCLGNSNNFHSQEECEAVCSA